MSQDLSAIFQNVYANLPLQARNEIIVVVDDEPLTWKSAKLEIDNNTPKGQDILQKLANMGFLHEAEK